MVVGSRQRGTDRVLASISYTLSDNVENLSLGDRARRSTGLATHWPTLIVGNAGANILDGRAGADTLTGGLGNDTFVFQRGETSGDKVTDFTQRALVPPAAITWSSAASVREPR